MSMRLKFLAMVAIALSGCATATQYAPASEQGGFGFAEQQIEANRFRITFRGNSSTQRESVENFLLFRAAELTVKNGYDHFIVVEGDTEAESSYTSAGAGFRGQAFGGPAFFGRYGYGFPGRFYAFPYYAYGFGWGSPYYDSYTREVTRYSAIAFVTMHNGEKPGDNPQAFDARDVMTNLRPFVFVEEADS